MDKALKTEAVNGETPAEEIPSASDEELAAAYALETAEEAEVDETPTDESEEVEETPEVKTEDEEEPSHSEKSRLGRKLARVERLLEEERQGRDRDTEIFKAEINQLKGYIQGTQDGEDPLNPEDVATVGNVQQIIDKALEGLKKAEDEKEQKLASYQKKYENFLADKADEDPDIFDDIYNMLAENGSPYNDIHTWNPAVDVEINYNKAKAALLSKARTKDKPNLKQEKARGTKVGETDKVDPGKQKTGVDISSLDADSKAFLESIRKRGDDPQELADKALGEKR